MRELVTKKYRLAYAGGQEGVLGLRFQKTDGRYEIFRPDQGRNDSRLEGMLVSRLMPSAEIVGEWVHRVIEQIDPRPLVMKKTHLRWQGTPAGSQHTDDSEWTVVWIPSGKTLGFEAAGKPKILKSNQVLFFRGNKVVHWGLDGRRLVYTYMFYPADSQPAVGNQKK